MNTNTQHWFKYSIGFVVCLLLRLVPFRPPNIEPLLATQMPFAKAHGGAVGFVFASLSIVLYDILTRHIGMWTLITALTYGLLGVWASHFFRKRRSSSMNYAGFAVMATIAYDIVTGLSVGPLFFHQTFLSALLGQIPFTALHLAGNICLALLVSPTIYRYIVRTRSLSLKPLLAQYPQYPL